LAALFEGNFDVEEAGLLGDSMPSELLPASEEKIEAKSFLNTVRANLQKGVLERRFE
jgi:hypothetical protein